MTPRTVTLGFETFQSRLRTRTGGNEIAWLLRDALFRELTAKAESREKRLLRIPGAWSILILKEWLAALAQAGILPTVPDTTRHHLLLVSNGANHISRIRSRLHRILRENGQVVVWCSRQTPPPDIPDHELAHYRIIIGAWAKYTQLRHLLDAYKTANFMLDVFPDESSRESFGNIFLYMVRFFGWRDFWKTVFRNTPESVCSTYEKGYDAKPLFLLASETGVPSRIFWLHGMTHESLESTAASEMWCMSQVEADGLKTLLPPHCISVYAQSPQSIALLEKIGYLDECERMELRHVNILVLGTGNDNLYDDFSRIEDLASVKKLQGLVGGSCSFRFRPHPGAIDRYRRNLNAAAISVNDFSQRSLEEDLSWSHAIMAPYSSVATDAFESGRQIFWTQRSNRNLYAISDYIKAEIGMRVEPESVFLTFSQRFPKIKSVQ